MESKKQIKFYIIIGIIALALLGALAWLIVPFFKKQETIKIGILHSLTGSMAISEVPVADATMIAIKEINNAGGIMGRQIEPIIADGASDENTFSLQAERLITQNKVVALFGGWTTPSRKAIKAVVEKHNNLLFYPAQGEGLETSPNIIYTSTVPNQQVIPGTVWCIQNLGKRIFLVGSDPIMDEIIKDVVYAYNGEVVGQEYIGLKTKNIDAIIKKIVDTKPDVILNNTEGEINITFFTKLRKAGISPEKIPTMSFSISEPELQLFNTNTMTGDYAAWSYFQSIDTSENKAFVKKVKAQYGNKQVTSDSMESGYLSIYFWKQAVEEAQSTNIAKVHETLKNQALDAPGGLVHIDEKAQYTWQFTRIGKIRSDKQFTIIWSSKKAIQPVPYPPTRNKADWESLITYWYEKWGKKWSD